MSTPTTTLIENIVLALITNQAPFNNATNAPTANYDSAQDLIGKQDILFVKADPAVPLVPAHAPYLPAPVQMSNVEVHIRMTNKSTAKIGDWIAAMETAIAGTSTNATNQVNTSFPNGFEVDTSTGGTRQGEGANQREYSRTMRVVFRP
jgi:opacity protein-like surface antigen